MFDAVVFAVMALGFEARSALERETGTGERLTKIMLTIGECRFGIHDLSFMRVDKNTSLPRYNMPFELGLFLACKECGGRKHSGKICLVMDRQRWRYRKSLSDLSGRDIKAHEGQPLKTIGAIRDWPATEATQSGLPGRHFIVERYKRFRRDLLKLCEEMRRRVSDLTFKDYCQMVRHWLRVNA